MKWFMFFVLLVVAGIAAYKYDLVNFSQLFDKKTKKENSYQESAALCGFGSEGTERRFKSNEKRTAYESCQDYLKKSSSTVQDKFFCFPQKDCP